MMVAARIAADVAWHRVDEPPGGDDNPGLITGAWLDERLLEPHGLTPREAAQADTSYFMLLESMLRQLEYHAGPATAPGLSGHRGAGPVQRLRAPAPRSVSLVQSIPGATVWIMVSFIRNVSFDCSDPYALARFWSEVTGHPVHPECRPGDTEVVIEPADGPRLFFQAVPEGKAVKNRVHVCLQPEDWDRDAEVDRVLALGATVLADHRTPDREGWVVLCDPAGNEFCVTRSSSERHS